MTDYDHPELKIVVLAGGVGGSKLVNGLAQRIKPENLFIIANTGDDFEHLGLWISPDVDTIMYTLAGVNNPETGWGRASESWSIMAQLEALGGPDWFRLGDQDLALNLLRTHWRRQGYPLSWITEQLCRRFGVRQQLTPMADNVVQTILHTDQGELPFQEYFVHRRCEPTVREIEYAGAEQAETRREIVSAVRLADLIVFAPSNPFLSIDPILALPGLARVIAATAAPKVAVSPIIGGAAVKGPAAKLMRELGLEISPFGVAQHLQHVLTGIVIDTIDIFHHPGIESLGLRTHLTQTLMKSTQDQAKLAGEVIEFGLSLLEK